VTRVAAVDLGTNSTRLLVADVAGPELQEVERRLTITRLGEDVDAGRRIVAAAASRVEACLADYMNLVEELGATRAVAFATSAVRDAENGREFLEGLERRFGIATRLLSGNEEALLTFHGVAASLQLDRATLVVDLGGGSTELIVGTAAEIDFHTSIDLGCVRLTERFLRHDPPSVEEIRALEAHVDDVLAGRVPAVVIPTDAVGVAGTVTTLATLHLELDEEDPALVHGHRLPASWIAGEAAQLAATPVEVLCTRRGLHPGRAPVIAAGALAIARILEYFCLPVLEVSENDVLHGVALELAA
jgi:exopolyphosphatase / guanosine-5'-triphosphate,3'-diphosphate pyrophosphatase